MDNQFKHRITRIFRSSCRSKDVIESAVLPADDHHQLIHLFSPRKHTPPPFPCLNCKPKLPDSFNTHNSCIVRKKSSLSDDREKLQLLNPCLDDGRKCPPASPITPFNFQSLPKNRVKKRNKNAARIRSSRTTSFGMNDFPACSYNGLFSSDEDDEEDDDSNTLFSSRSLSSESSRSFRQEGSGSGSGSRRVLKKKLIEEGGKEIEGSCATEENSFAVMKRSNDPYNDFRTSMEEMIIQKQIFTAKDLEDLLHCFLSLNSSRHHRVIVQVFNDISDALFT